MKTHGEMSLEKYRFFPIVAWLIFIGFALFVYNITIELRDVSNALSSSSISYTEISNQIERNSERLDALEAANAASVAE